jgi:hypothetical protein
MITQFSSEHAGYQTGASIISVAAESIRTPTARTARAPRETIHTLRGEITQLRFAVRLLESYINAVEQHNVRLQSVLESRYPAEMEQANQNVLLAAERVLQSLPEKLPCGHWKTTGDSSGICIECSDVHVMSTLDDRDLNAAYSALERLRSRQHPIGDATGLERFAPIPAAQAGAHAA